MEALLVQIMILKNCKWWGTSGGNVSFINDNTTTCVMKSSGVSINVADLSSGGSWRSKRNKFSKWI